MRIATWNVNSLKVRLPRVEEWLAYAHPDVLCLQETKLADATFPHLAFSALGYESVHHGDGRWNGVAILSRVGIDDVVTGFAGPGRPGRRDPDHQRPLWRGPDDQRLRPNGRSLDSDHYQYKLDWLGGSASTSMPWPIRTTGWRCAATSTSRPRTATSGTQGVRRRDPRQRARARRPATPGGLGAGRRLPGAATPMTGSSATGTIGPATSTSTGACGSTWCCCPGPWPSR